MIVLIVVCMSFVTLLLILILGTYWHNKHPPAQHLKNCWLANIAQDMNCAAEQLDRGHYASAAAILSHLLYMLDVEDDASMVSLKEQFREYEKVRVHHVQEAFVKINAFLNKTYFMGYKNE